jgi:AcrR family transcriptional regulator
MEEIKRDRKEDIFAAAVLCFNKTGYFETSIDTIAAEAKISKGGIYYHFKSKKELFLDLFRYRVNKYFNYLKAYTADIDNPEERLRVFINKASNIQKENADFFKFCIEFLSMGVRDKEVRNVMTAFYRESVGTFRGYVEEGIRLGIFLDHDAEKTALAIYFLFMGVFLTYFSVDVEYDLIEQHSFQLNNIFETLKKR